jgi:hypothetical protein
MKTIIFTDQLSLKYFDIEEQSDEKTDEKLKILVFKRQIPFPDGALARKIGEKHMIQMH